jgi:acyl-CoA oxidase
VSAVLRMIGDAAIAAVREQNPLARRDRSRDHLRDRAFHLAAFAHRRDTLVQSLARRMRKRIQVTRDAHIAMLEVQEHLIATARAYVDHLALAWFEEEVSHIDDAATRAVLARVGDLHALSRLEEEAAWFLEDGYWEPAKARAVRKEVEALMNEIAPAARDLVEAFAIPDACLAAPIAFFDPAHPRYA